MNDRTHYKVVRLLKLALIVATLMLKDQFATPDDVLVFIRQFVSEDEVLTVSMMVKDIMTRETVTA